MKKLTAGDVVEAKVSGFCGGPVSHARVTVTKVSTNGATWWGTEAGSTSEISGSTGDVVAWWPR